MKIKVKPQDFIVEEITDIVPCENGEYVFFKLKKEGVETIETIKEIARRFVVDLGDVGYAGIKDRYAQTTQYITVKSAKELPDEIKGKNYYLKNLGRVSSAIKPGDLRANKFMITLRELCGRDVRRIRNNVLIIEKTGVVNYYDSQRFGSTRDNVFIAKYLLRKDYEGAVKQFILSQYEEKQRSRLEFDYKRLVDGWKDFGSLKLRLPYLDFLQKEYSKTKDWRQTYKRIPSKLRELILMSYQSYLWNECVKEVIAQKALYRRVKYNVGELYFPVERIDKFKFPLIGRKMDASYDYLEVVNKVLEKEDITFEEIKQIQKSGNFLKSTNEEVVVDVKELKIIDVLKDDLYPKSYKIKVSFILPKGSYATIVIKQLNM